MSPRRATVAALILLAAAPSAAGRAAAGTRPVSTAAVNTAAVNTAAVNTAAASTTATRATARPAAALLRLGSRGPAVRSMQSRLVALTFLPPGAADGIFGVRTWHAVIAFQGWSRLARDGVVGPRTQRALARGRVPRPWSTATGMEVHMAQQVLLLVRGGRVRRAIHVSTGRPGRPTPTGHFRIRARSTLSWSVPFQTWMPLAQYFTGGYAIHEYPEVPAYPASHGCIRVPASESRVVWNFGAVGMRFWTTR